MWVFPVRVFALFSLLVCLPFLMVIALLIFVWDRESPLHFSPRLGKNRVVFSMVKLRTMRKKEEEDQVYTKDSDRRITPIGFWLRRLKIDELPQLWNITLGHMAFFGPRPDVPQTFGFYARDERKIFTVLPGLVDISSLIFAKEGRVLACDGEGNTYKDILLLKKALTCFYIDNTSARMNFLILILLFIRLVSDHFFILSLRKFLIFFSVPKTLQKKALFYASI